jgi:hypothetical protein
LPRRKRKARRGFPGSASGESLVSLVIWKELLKRNVSHCALSWRDGVGVNRDFVDFLDQEGEVELAEVSPAESDEKLAVMEDQEIGLQGVSADIVITDAGPIGAVLETEP